MNKKQILILAGGLLLLGGEDNSISDTQTKQQILDITQTTKFPDTVFFKKQNIHGKEIKTKNKENKPTTININLPLEGKSPLRMRGVKQDLGAMLGHSQTETIIKKYNTIIPKLQTYTQLTERTQERTGTENELYNTINYQNIITDKKINSKDKYEKYGNINFPLIYPELKEYFPEDLKDIIKHESFNKYQEKIKHTAIIVTRCENNRTALGYYKDGKILLATYVSIGIGHRTIQGLFHGKKASKYKRSYRYKSAAMPYSIHITGNYFLHQGKSDGTNRSHGCIRVPGFYQKFLYEDIEKLDEKNQKIAIILDGLYKKTLYQIPKENKIENRKK